MTSDRDSMMRAIVQNPDEDSPRMAFADLIEELSGSEECAKCKGTGKTRSLDDAHRYYTSGTWTYTTTQCPDCSGSGQVSNGNFERAQFIRVQCQIPILESILAAPYEDQDLCTECSARWCPVCGDCCCPNPEEGMNYPACPLHSPESRHAGDTSLKSVLAKLKKEEERLLGFGRKKGGWFDLGLIGHPESHRDSPEHRYPLTWWEISLPLVREIAGESRRGFVDTLSICHNTFIPHAGRIFSMQPIREILILDRSAVSGNAAVRQELMAPMGEMVWMFMEQTEITLQPHWTIDRRIIKEMPKKNRTYIRGLGGNIEVACFEKHAISYEWLSRACVAYGRKAAQEVKEFSQHLGAT